jgi:asparagine synthase (glutamine-hydrolysing)
MCGIAGIFDPRGEGRITEADIAPMVRALAHRGPDQKGIYLDRDIGLGHSRLSIIDLEGGGQPIHNEDETVWIVLNGEIYNFPELRTRLENRGHRFYTRTDTEVLVHLYEDKGPSCVDDLNGQFAFGIWDRNDKSLFLARDPLGICPLYYGEHQGLTLFASEIKAIFASKLIPSPGLNPKALDQVFTFWATLPGETAFNGIRELPSGHSLHLSAAGRTLRQYWDIPYCPPEEFSPDPPRALCDRILALLTDATRIRLRADVTVGAYLSGGLDSSGISALIARHFDGRLRTFGVRFEDRAFDEGRHQKEMAAFLGVEHQEFEAESSLIAGAFPRVVWHCETPILRTAPVPMFLLSGLVHEQGIKVVCTGEGADEIFGGYDIFREALVRQFVLRRPSSPRRAELFERLYPQIFRTQREKLSFRRFMAGGPADPADPLFSHLVRWNNTSRIKQFFTDDLRTRIGGYSAIEDLVRTLPPDFGRRDMLSKAQYLEDKIFLSNYLLTSQGDRMAMAHAVEIRPPYLDVRLIDLMSRVSPRWKILGLDEKHILKKAFRDILPASVTQRTKQPYRAPIQSVFAGRLRSESYGDALSERGIRDAGIFDFPKVLRLFRKLDSGASTSETEGMAVAGIVSTQLLFEQAVRDYSPPQPEETTWDLEFDGTTGSRK